MRKLWIVMILTVLPLAAVYSGGRQEASLEDPPETPIELEEYASKGVPKEETVQSGAASKAGASAGADAGDEALTLSVDEAVQIAVGRNLSLRSKAIGVRTKKRQADYAWNELLPSAKVSGTMSRANKKSSQDIPVGTMNAVTPGILEPIVTEEVDMPRWSLAAGLDFSLSLNIALDRAIRSTRKAWRAEMISYRKAEAQLERDVRKSFYNLLLLDEQRRLQEEKIDTAKDRYEQAQINYENGLVPELSVLNAEVAYENQKPALKSLELGYRQALQRFKMNLGIDLNRELSLDGSIETDSVELDAQKLIEKYLARRYDVRSLIANIETLEDQYTANKLRAFTPTLTLMYNFDPTFQGDPMEDPWFDDISNDWKQSRGGFTMTIGMSLDGLLPFSRTQVGLREMEDSIAQMRVNLQQAMRGAEMEISNTVDQLEKSLDTIETLQLNVRRAERAYEMAEEAYNVGSRELLEVKDAQDELQKAKVEVLKEKYNYVSALLDLEYAINADVDEAAETSKTE